MSDIRPPTLSDILTALDVSEADGPQNQITAAEILAVQKWIVECLAALDASETGTSPAIPFLPRISSPKLYGLLDAFYKYACNVAKAMYTKFHQKKRHSIEILRESKRAEEIWNEYQDWLNFFRKQRREYEESRDLNFTQTSSTRSTLSP